MQSGHTPLLSHGTQLSFTVVRASLLDRVLLTCSKETGNCRSNEGRWAIQPATDHEVPRRCGGTREGSMPLTPLPQEQTGRDRSRRKNHRGHPSVVAGDKQKGFELQPFLPEKGVTHTHTAVLLIVASLSHRGMTRFRAVTLLGGVFAQRAHSAGTAPIITVIIQVKTLKTTHLRNHAQSNQNSKIQTSDACHGSQGPKFCPL